MSGWRCCRCGRSYSPIVLQCVACNSSLPSGGAGADIAMLQQIAAQYGTHDGACAVWYSRDACDCGWAEAYLAAARVGGEDV